MLNLSMPKSQQYEIKPRITVVGVGGAGKRRQQHDPLESGGRRVHRLQHRCPGAGAVDLRPPPAARHQRHARPRRRVAPRRRPPGRRGGAWTSSWPSSTAPTWCSSPPAWAAAPARARRRSSPRRPRARHPDGRRGHQALPLRGHPPHEDRRERHQRAAAVRRHPDHHPEPEPVPRRQREDDLRRRLRHGRPGAAFGRARRHRSDGDARPHQPRLRGHPRRS